MEKNDDSNPTYDFMFSLDISTCIFLTITVYNFLKTKKIV
jgi:hypothetical protein